MADGTMLRIATAPVNWNNSDVPDWRPHVPFPAILDEIRSAGFEVTEYDATLGNDLEVVAAQAARRSMSICGAYRWIDLGDDHAFRRDLASIEPMCEQLARIGGEHLIVADSMRPERVALAGRVPSDGSLSMDAAGYSRMAERLSEVVTVCGGHGIAVHYHNHAGTLIETPSEVDALAKLLPAAGLDLCFDTGHFVFGGGDPERFIDLNLGAIGYLHLKDVDGGVLALARAGGWSLPEALREVVFAPLGAGTARIERLVRSLVHREFEGYVVIEQDTCIGDPTVNARANLDWLRGVLRQPMDRVSEEGSS